jgi:hypothetical protein
MIKDKLHTQSDSLNPTIRKEVADPNQPLAESCRELGFSRRLPQGVRLSAGCGRNWLNLCGARN